MKHKPYEKLKGAFKERKVTYRDIGATLGISTGAVYKKIRGVSDFTLSETQTIEYVYGIGVRFFSP